MKEMIIHIHIILFRNRLGKRTFGRNRHKKSDIWLIKMDNEEIWFEGVNWIQLAKTGVKW